MTSIRTLARRRHAARARLRAAAAERAAINDARTAIAALQGSLVPEAALGALLATKRPYTGSPGAIAAQLATGFTFPPPLPARDWDDLDN